MENVPGIKSEFNNKILTEFLERLRKHYDVKENVLNAANYGVPQARKRFVLHAVRKDINEELKKMVLRLICQRSLMIKMVVMG